MAHCGNKVVEVTGNIHQCSVSSPRALAPRPGCVCVCLNIFLAVSGLSCGV